MCVSRGDDWRGIEKLLKTSLISMTGSTGAESGSTATAFSTRYMPDGTAVTVLPVPRRTGTTAGGTACDTAPSGQSYWILSGTEAVPRPEPPLESLFE